MKIKFFMLILGAVIVMLAATGCASTPASPTASPIATALPPTETPVLATEVPATDTPVPTPTVAVPQNVKDFVEWYFNAVWQERNYDFLWNNCLTPAFQANAATGGYAEFTSWWGSMEQVDINKVTVLQSDTTTASVEVNVTFHLNTGKTLSNRLYRYDLTYSQAAHTWQFDFLQ